MARLGQALGAEHLYIKRDDLGGRPYGGNKVRKLEFLLGDALRRGAREVLTFGYAGSNHALATAIYARRVGLRSISMLLPQRNAAYVCHNLLLAHACGAELHQYRNIPLLIVATALQMLCHRAKTGRFPQLIPTGGSSPLGTVGIVNGAFELAEQVHAGEMPEPDLVYVAAGSMGTAVGLMLGLKAAGLKSRVIAVRASYERFVNARGMVRLFQKTNALLCSADPGFPTLECPEREVHLRHEFFGDGYALVTEECREAMELAERWEGIKFEGTYTGKAFAALIHDVRKGECADRVALFWNTCNSNDFSNVIAGVDHRRLPRCFHRYFGVH